MRRRALSTTMKASRLKSVKIPARDPDAQLFLKRAKEPLEDCLAAIERRIAQILSTHAQFLALIERSRARQKAEGGISPAEMRRRLGLKRTARSAR